MRASGMGVGVLALMLGSLPGPADAEPPPGGLRVHVATPHDGAVIASADPSVVVAGRVLETGAELDTFDIAIVIDRSKSTDAPTGIDIDGDGWVGRAPDSRFSDGSSDDRGDSVLAAEIVAAHTLLEQLDPATTRVALVAFSGDSDPETPDATTLAALSSDYARVHHQLDEVLDDWPSGRTNLAESLHRATAELLGIGGTTSQPRERARKIILLMTDGRPTLPVPFAPARNAEAAFTAADLAARASVRVDTFAIGRSANEDDHVARGVAERTGGRFTPVLEPRDLLSTFENLRLTEVEAVEAHNRTAGKAAEAVMLEPDGRFSALLPLEPGQNVLEIRARDPRGRWTWRTLRVDLVPGETLQALHPRWLERRTRLLEEKLARLRRQHVEIEARQQASDLDAHLRALHGEPPASPDEPAPARSIEIRAEPAAP